MSQGLTLQQVIDTLVQYRDRHHVPKDAPVRFEIAPQATLDVDGVSWIGDHVGAIVFTSEDAWPDE